MNLTMALQNAQQDHENSVMGLDSSRLNATMAQSGPLPSDMPTDSEMQTTEVGETPTPMEGQEGNDD